MPDTPKSQNTVRRKRKIGKGGLTPPKKKGGGCVRKTEWAYWKKKLPVWGWRRGTDEGQSSADRILLKRPICFALPCSSGSSREQGAGAAGAEACRRQAGQELLGQPQSPAVPAGCCASSAFPSGVGVRRQLILRASLNCVAAYQKRSTNPASALCALWCHRKK